MSGGHFCDCGYIYHQVSQFARELEDEILNNDKPDEYGYTYNYSSEVIEYLEEQVHLMHKMADIMWHIDKLYSGDHGEDSFMQRIQDVERKYG